MREWLLRGFVSFLGDARGSKRASRLQHSRRRLSFQSLESRQMLSAAEIIEENDQPGATLWQVRAPLTADIKDANDVVIRAKERNPGPYNTPWNGFTDSTQQTYNDRVQGFTVRPSYDLGELSLAIEFKVDCPFINYVIEIYRLGDYGGAGARLVAKLADRPLRAQDEAPPEDQFSRVRECSNWVVSDLWAPEKINGRYHYRSPTDAPLEDGTIEAFPLLSGVYYAKIKRLDNTPYEFEKASAVVFVLTDKAATSDIVMQTADASWQAYNTWGNRSLYHNKLDAALNDINRAFKVSYNRPYDTVLPVLGEEHFTIRFLEQNGYDVTYTTHVDVDRYYNEKGDAPGPGSLRQHKVYMVGGHDEYWSGEHVKALETARIDDVSLIFWTGNEGFWKTRWENNYQWLACYKETQNNGIVQDPTNIFTGLFRDLRSGNVQDIPFNPEREVLQPENALTGTSFAMNFTGNQWEPAYSNSPLK